MARRLRVFSAGAIEADAGARTGVELGERLKRARKGLGYSLADVSAMTALSTSWLSRVERGQIDISFNRLMALTSCYRVSLPDLLGSSTGSSPHIVRKPDRPSDTSSPEGFDLVLLAPGQRQMMPAVAIHRPGVNPDDFVTTEGEEFVLVLDGTIELEFANGTSYSLKKGDSAYYSGLDPHRVTVPGKSAAEIVVVAAPPW
jgi:transcriptional regulator with XRE-family HTH domain